jgi:hypothetical protein
MRQYGSVPPILSTAQPPAVSATTGLGTGGGAGVQSPLKPADGQGQFYIDIQVGSNPSAGGSVTLVFPSMPPLLFIAGQTSFGTITAPNNDGAHTTIVVNWAGQLRANARMRIDCEWAVST